MKHTNVWTKVLLLALCLVLGLSCLFSCNGEEIEQLNNATSENAKAIEELKTLVNTVKGTADAAATAAALEAVKADLASVKTTADAAATAAKLDEVEAVLTALINQNTATDTATKTALEEAIAANKTALEQAIAAVKATADAAVTKEQLDAAIANVNTSVTNAINSVNSAIEAAKTELNNKIDAANKALNDFKAEYAEDLKGLNDADKALADRITAIEGTIADLAANIEDLENSDALAEYKSVTEFLKNDETYSYAKFKELVASVDEAKYPKAQFAIFSKKAEEAEFFLSRAVTIAEVKDIFDGFVDYLENEFPTLYEVYVEMYNTVVITPDGKSIGNNIYSYNELIETYQFLVDSGEYDVESLTVDGTLTIKASKELADAAKQNVADAAAAVNANVCAVISEIDNPVYYVTTAPDLAAALDAITTFKTTYFGNEAYNEFYVSRDLDDAAEIAKTFIANYNVYETANARYTVLDNACADYIEKDFCDEVDNYPTERPLWTDLAVITEDYNWYTNWVALNNEDDADDIEEQNIINICNQANATLVLNIANAQTAYTNAITAAADALAAKNANAAAIVAKTAEIEAATDDAVKATLEEELAALQLETAVLEAAVAAADANVDTCEEAVEAAIAVEPTKPVITASADLYVVKAYKFATAMNEIFVDYEVEALNAAFDAFVEENTKDGEIYVYYTNFDKMFADDTGFYALYQDLYNAIKAVPESDVTGVTNNNFEEMFKYNNEDRVDNFAYIYEVLETYEEAKDAIVYVLTVGVPAGATIEGSPIGMLEALADTEMSDVFGHRLNHDYYETFKEALTTIYTACDEQNIIPQEWVSEIKAIEGKDANKLEDILYLYEVVSVSIPKDAEGNDVITGDVNYFAIVDAIKAELAETYTDVDNFDPQYVLAYLNARYSAYTKGISDLCTVIINSLGKFESRDTMALVHGWEFIADSVNGEWVVSPETGYANKLAFIALQIGAGNIILEIGGSEQSISLYDLLDEYEACIQNYKAFAYEAEGASVNVNAVIAGAADIFAAATDLNNREAILAVWDTYMAWAENYLKNDVEGGVTTNLNHLAAIEALYDNANNGIPCYGESHNFAFVTPANFTALYNAYNTTNETYAAAQAAWEILKPRLEALDTADEWNIHNFGDLYNNETKAVGPDGKLDVEGDVTSFVSVKAQFITYAQTYYAVTDAEIPSLRNWLNTINVVDEEFETFKAFNVQYAAIERLVGTYKTDADMIIGLIKALAEVTYQGVLVDGKVTVENAEAASKALLDSAVIANKEADIYAIQTLIDQFHDKYCDGECVGLDADGEYTLMFKKAVALVAAAKVTVANAAHPRYLDIVGHYYQIASQMNTINNVNGVEGATTLFNLRVEAIVGSVQGI